MDNLIITRMNPPTQHDTAPYNTRCICQDDTSIVWIQMSHDEENPKWISFQKENIPTA